MQEVLQAFFIDDSPIDNASNTLELTDLCSLLDVCLYLGEQIDNQRKEARAESARHELDAKMLRQKL